MKTCPICEHECDDNVTLCPRCGRKFFNKSYTQNEDQKFNIQFDANNQPQSPSDYVSSIKSEINHNTQKSTVSSQPSDHNEGNKIFNSLWMLISFIPFINGFGIFYIGKKTSKKS